jgi:hypothetical protein
MRWNGLNRSICLVVIMAGVMGSQWDSTAAEPLQAIPTAGAGTVGTLYNPDPSLDLPRSERIGSIINCASSGSFLHVALRSLEGEERIDTWDLSNPSTPILEQSLSFGNIQQNGIRFIPMAMVAIPGGLLVQTSDGWSRYTLRPGDGLVDPIVVTVPTTGVGIENTQLHIVDHFGSFQQQLIPFRELTNDSPLFGQVLVDFSSPDAPFLHWSPHVLGQSFTHPVNAKWKGMPGSLWFDPSGTVASLQVARPNLENHLNSFWDARLDQVFNQASLNQSVGYLMDATLEVIPLKNLQAEALQLVIRNMPHPDATITARIMEEELSARNLVDVLRERHISLEDPLGSVLEKIASARLSAGLESEMAAIFFDPIVGEWQNTVFRIDDNVQTVGQLRDQIEGVFNVAMDDSGLAQYIALELVGPLFGDSEFLRWTLNDLMTAIERSDVGASLDLILRTADGFGAVSGLLDMINDGLGLLGDLLGADIPSLPRCALFPTSTHELMDLALFSWNDQAAGLSLDREGLAWMELIKFHQYLQGNSDFLGFLNSLEANLHAWHHEYAGDIVQQFSPWVEGVMDWNLPLDTRSHLSATAFPIRQLVAQWMVRGFWERIDPEQNLSLDIPLRVALDSWNLSVGQLGHLEATIEDLNAALRLRGADDWTLQTLVRAIPENIPLSEWRGEVFQSLRAQMFAQFGINDPDLTLRSMLEHYLTQQVDFDGVLGTKLDSMFGQMLSDVPIVGQWLHTFDRASQGDCIAQWQVALKAISASSIAVDGGTAAAAMDAALTAAYETAVDWSLQFLLGLWAEEVVKIFDGEHRTSLASRWEQETWTFDLSTLVSVERASTRTVGAGTGRDRVVFVMEHRFEEDWFGPRSVELLTFHPGNPEETVQRWDLGRWNHVNSTVYTEGILWLSGTRFGPDDDRFPNDHALAIRLDTDAPMGFRFAGREHLLLSSAEKILSVNHNSMLAIVSGNKILIAPNPTSSSVSERWQARRPVWIDWLPEQRSLREGEPWTFPTLASGTFPMVYRLWRDGEVAAESHDGLFALPKVSKGMEGEYVLEALNEAGSVWSGPFELDIDFLPRITFNRENENQWSLGVIDAPMDHIYLLERTRDFQAWNQLETGQVIDEKMTFEFTETLQAPQWIYRVRFENN